MLYSLSTFGQKLNVNTVSVYSITSIEKNIVPPPSDTFVIQQPGSGGFVITQVGSGGRVKIKDF